MSLPALDALLNASASPPLLSANKLALLEHKEEKSVKNAPALWFVIKAQNQHPDKKNTLLRGICLRTPLYSNVGFNPVRSINLGWSRAHIILISPFDYRSLSTR